VQILSCRKCHGGTIEVHAFISDVEGRNMIRRQAGGSLSEAMQIGERVARALLDAGGREILNDLERDQGKGDSGRVGLAPPYKKGTAYLVGAGPGRGRRT
jgi:hypothetical protein